MTEGVTLDIPPSEMLPEDSPQQIRFVIVMPQFQTEPLSEIDHTKMRPEVPEPNSLPSRLPAKSKSPQHPSKQAARDIATTSYSPRLLFTDNWNSFWHIAFGVLAIKFRMLVPAFIFYQFLDLEDVNVFIDIIEFLCGYILGLVFNWV
jgi:hypothetical protein